MNTANISSGLPNQKHIVLIAALFVTQFAFIGVLQAAEFIARVNNTPTAAEFNSGSIEPYISASGRYMVFTSNATNALPDSNFKQQIYFTERLSEQSKCR